MADSDLEGFRAMLLGLGLTQLAPLMDKLAKARARTANVSAGRHPDDHGDGPPPRKGAASAQAQPQESTSLESMLAPLLAQMGGQGGTATMPQNSPGMRPGAPPAPLPTMAGLPRTIQASG
jgi:hypothetical protein